MALSLEKSASNFHLDLSLVSEGILAGKMVLKSIYFKEQMHK